MVRKKLDVRLRTLIENGVGLGHRSMFVIVGEKARDQVVLLHHILSKATVAARPSVLWCYKKELGFSSHRKKRMRELQKKARAGNTGADEEDLFDNFISSTEIRYCYYNETEKILGNTYGMLVLQDFEAITPNVLARTIETVSGGGLVLILLPTVSCLKQLYSMTMDVHSRYRTEAHDSVVARFNERFILSLADCNECVVIDDQLNVLPVSSHVLDLEPIPAKTNLEKTPSELELSDLKEKMSGIMPPGPILKQCKTLCQAKVVLRLLDILTERNQLTTCAITAARGRGKSAALGLVIAGAIAFNFTTVYVTSPSPENVKTLFKFVVEGLIALNMKEHADYELTYSTEQGSKDVIVRVSVFRNHRQSVKYVEPSEHVSLSDVELLVIDEAAAIPLPIVQSLLKGSKLSFFSSTTNGYEGTGRSLSLKLIQQLRQQMQKGGSTEFGKVLHEMSLEESIRYKSGDQVERWLNKLLCLDVTAWHLTGGTPPPELCQLYYVNRDALFSYHKAAEKFLSRMMSIFVSAHYKNNPNDLQMLSDAPAQHVFVLLSPVSEGQTEIPDILAVCQVGLEGELSSQTVHKEQSKGHKSSGDMIPWTVCQYFLDYEFPKMAGARIIRLAVHPDVQNMGYGSQLIKMLREYYEGKVVCLNDKNREEYELCNIKRHLSDGNDIKPPASLPPILRKLSERQAEKLDYLGVSFGVNVQLLKFWKRNEFSPVYLRTTPSPVTSEYSCIMLSPLDDSNSEGLEKDPAWLQKYSAEFRRRFLSLLGYQFQNFSPHLVLSLLQNASNVADKQTLDRNELRLFLSDFDLKRLANYSRNMADYSFIVDLLPTLATLYFNGRLGSEVSLNALQSAAILAMGLQRKSAQTVAKELQIDVSQLLALFNKTMRKFSEYLDNLCKSSIKVVARDVSDLKPTERSLVDELKAAEMEIRARQARDKVNLVESLGLDKNSIHATLKQYAIKASDNDFQNATKSVHLAHAKPGGILSVEVERPKDKPTNIFDAELQETHAKPTKRANHTQNKLRKKKKRN